MYVQIGFFVTNHNHHYNGRIVIAWQPSSFIVDVMYSSAQMIHYRISVNNDKKSFLFSFIYGFNEPQNKESLWTDLMAIANKTSEPWCIGGDFNSILNLDERVGSPVKDSEIVPMRSCMSYCKLEDVKAMGRFYTWTNKQAGSVESSQKLTELLSYSDQDLSCHSWEETFQILQPLVLQ